MYQRHVLLIKINSAPFIYQQKREAYGISCTSFSFLNKYGSFFSGKTRVFCPRKMFCENLVASPCTKQRKIKNFKRETEKNQYLNLLERESAWQQFKFGFKSPVAIRNVQCIIQDLFLVSKIVPTKCTYFCIRKNTKKTKH